MAFIEGLAEPGSAGAEASAVWSLPLDVKIAVLIPCYNEAITIGTVVSDFKRYLPGVEIFVYDNNSTDDTRSAAIQAGARVFREPMQGKGHVVRRMFRDVSADYYILVDGDGPTP